MNNRRTILTVVATALVALCLPVLAAAQGSYGRNEGYYGRYDARSLREAARRVSDRSRDFQRHLDSALDRSRYDDTRREDRINDAAQEFRSAASNFKDRISDARNANRAAGEARQLLQIAARIDRFVSRNRLDSRAASDWSQIRQDLRLIADAYGFNFNSGYDRRDDDYRRNDDRNRRRDNDPWQQRIPRP
ncbi:MAG TPA: hypothetical protein VGC89_06960 [Pyrinomonadaceae bacterium]|jgi:hypothetical protein